jgi:hypothetical protein
VLVSAVLGLIVIVVNVIAFASGAYNTPDTNAAMLAAMF